MLIRRITREHRDKLAKSAIGLFTKYKKAVRDVQIKYFKKLELRENISVEQSRRVQEQVSMIFAYLIYLENCEGKLQQAIFISDGCVGRLLYCTNGENEEWETERTLGRWLTGRTYFMFYVISHVCDFV